MGDRGMFGLPRGCDFENGGRRNSTPDSRAKGIASVRARAHENFSMRRPYNARVNEHATAALVSQGPYHMVVAVRFRNCCIVRLAPEWLWTENMYGWWLVGGWLVVGWWLATLCGLRPDPGGQKFKEKVQ